MCEIAPLIIFYAKLENIIENNRKEKMPILNSIVGFISDFSKMIENQFFKINLFYLGEIFLTLISWYIERQISSKNDILENLLKLLNELIMLTCSMFLGKIDFVTFFIRFVEYRYFSIQNKNTSLLYNIWIFFPALKMKIKGEISFKHLIFAEDA